MTQSFFFFWHVSETFNDASRAKDVHTVVMYQQFEVYTLIYKWCWDIFRWCRWFLPEKNYMYLKQWSHQSHDTMTLSKDRRFWWWDVIESECYKDDNAKFTSPPLGTCELILVENHCGPSHNFQSLPFIEEKGGFFGHLRHLDKIIKSIILNVLAFNFGGSYISIEPSR